MAKGGALEPIVHIALLTAGRDKHYCVPLATALAGQGVLVDFIGGDNLNCPEVTGTIGVTFLNLRGDRRENVSLVRKALRVMIYYARLIQYTAVAKPRILHILWNNKFQVFDRTLLMLFYRLVGKRVVFTAHNVNAGKRDSCDGWINRLSLRIQYHLCDHIFVHTNRMKHDLATDFDVSESKISVIPYGINNMIPTTGLTAAEARQHLGIAAKDKTALFFGMITPYKGLEYLVSALTILSAAGKDIRLIIAGQVKTRGCDDYWRRIQQVISESGIRDKVIQRIEFIPDEDIEHYFKAADVVVLPYTNIFQSGIQFLSYRFGVPVIATDVGSLKEDVIDNTTGFLCSPRDPAALAGAIERYFASELYEHLERHREEIICQMNQRHSWTTVGEITRSTYTKLLLKPAHLNRGKT